MLSYFANHNAITCIYWATFVITTIPLLCMINPPWKADKSIQHWKKCSYFMGIFTHPNNRRKDLQNKTTTTTTKKKLEKVWNISKVYDLYGIKLVQFYRRWQKNVINFIKSIQWTMLTQNCSVNSAQFGKLSFTVWTEMESNNVLAYVKMNDSTHINPKRSTFIWN